MQERLVDFITSLDGYGAAEGWPGLLAALLLLVQGEARSRPATHLPRPLMRASCRCPGCHP